MGARRRAVSRRTRSVPPPHVTCDRTGRKFGWPENVNSSRDVGRPRSDEKNRSVTRAFRIVDSLSGTDGMGVSELADDVGLPVSTVHDYLQALRSTGHVRKAGTEYRTSTRFLETGHRDRRQREIYTAVADELSAAAEETGEQAWESAQSMLRVPTKLENTLDRAQRGNLTLQVELNDQKGVIDRLAKRIVYGLVFSFSILATAYLYQGASLYAAGVSGAIGIIGGILLWLSFRDKKGLRAQPQFTRQNMRKRREE